MHVRQRICSVAVHGIPLKNYNPNLSVSHKIFSFCTYDGVCMFRCSIHHIRERAEILNLPFYFRSFFSFCRASESKSIKIPFSVGVNLYKTCKHMNTEINGTRIIPSKAKRKRTSHNFIHSFFSSFILRGSGLIYMRFGTEKNSPNGNTSFLRFHFRISFSVKPRNEKKIRIFIAFFSRLLVIVVVVPRSSMRTTRTNGCIECITRNIWREAMRARKRKAAITSIINTRRQYIYYIFTTFDFGNFHINTKPKRKTMNASEQKGKMNVPKAEVTNEMTGSLRIKYSRAHSLVAIHTNLWWFQRFNCSSSMPATFFVLFLRISTWLFLFRFFPARIFCRWLPRVLICVL